MCINLIPNDGHFSLVSLVLVKTITSLADILMHALEAKHKIHHFILKLGFYFDDDGNHSVK
jgi:hypothetical protein